MEPISANQAILGAVRAIEEEGVEGCWTLKKCIENKDLIHHMFINRLDDPSSSYYILYWLINNRIMCIAEVDAFDGKLMSFTPFTHPGTEHYHNAELAIEIIRQKFPGHRITAADLVWQPCCESSSSLFPFRRIFTDHGTYFVSMHGDIYHELTPLVTVH